MTVSIEDIKQGGVGEPEVEEQGKDEKFEVEVIDTRPPEDQVDPAKLDDKDDEDGEPTEQELLDVSNRVQKRIKKLTFKFNEERRRAEAAVKMQDEAIRFAEQQRDENARMHKIMGQGEEVLLSEIRSRTNSDVDRAKQEYAAAVDEGDSGSITKAQMALNRAQIEQHQAEVYSPQAKQQLSDARSLESAPPTILPGVPLPQVDARFESWKTDNDWFDENRRMRAVALDVHSELKESAEKTGVIVGSDEYYTEIDSVMKQEFPSYFEEPQQKQGVEDASESSANPAPSVVAPTTRNVASKSPRKVQITETARDLAARLNIPLEVYAREFAILEAKKNV